MSIVYFSGAALAIVQVVCGIELHSGFGCEQFHYASGCGFVYSGNFAQLAVGFVEEEVVVIAAGVF